jgi:putative DNA primase/helicase
MDLRDGDTKIVRNLLAYRKVGLEKETEEFWVPPTVFDKEFVMGVNKAELVKELQRLGWLLPPRHDGGNAEFGQNSTLRLKTASCIACKEVS